MNDVQKVVGGRGILVAEACNGFGKTVCALSSILPLECKVVYATRTHEQVRQVLLEVERINKSSGTTFSAVNLASRQHLCLNEQCRVLSAREAAEACRLLKEAGECPYRTEIKLSWTIPSVVSMKKLHRQGKARGVCPYFLARKVAEDCIVIVAPYHYIFNEHIRNRVKLELSNRILVFDEAHNADQIGQDVLSSTLSERTLNSAKQELESTKVSSDFIDPLTAYLEKEVSKKAVTKQGVILHGDLKRVLGVENLSSFAAGFSDLVDEIRAHKMESGNYPICFLNGLLNFLKHVDSSPLESYVTIYRRSFQGFNIVEYRCLDPSLAIKPVVEESRGTLIMSGTLSPLNLFTEILGLKQAEKRTYASIANPENVRTIIDSSVTTRFNERSEEMIRRYGERLSRLIHRIPNGVLVFFPQRRLMMESLTYWRKTGTIQQIGASLFLEGKSVFVEGARAAENRRVVKEYKSTEKNGRKMVCDGRVQGS
jgi:Rad3-related DNA helicase